MEEVLLNNRKSLLRALNSVIDVLLVIRVQAQERAVPSTQGRKNLTVEK